MSALARPGIFASVLAAGAVALHPALGASRLPAYQGLVAALLLLGVSGLLVRALSLRRVDAAFGAAGAAVLVGALAADGVVGHHGTVTLAPGQSQGNFEEISTDGRALGLRPLGFPVRVEGASTREGAARVSLALPGRRPPVELTPHRSVAFGGYRFARPAATTPGSVARLRVAASDGKTTEVADISPGVPGRVFGLAVAAEQYFPDFALDENRRPFSRSAEPRNPAALLAVEKGGQAHRVFVLQSMPGVHRLEELGLAFSLLEVEPERAVVMAVHREPAAVAALGGAVLLAAGLALSLRLRPAHCAGGGRAAVTSSALVFVALLLLTGRGSLLSWTFATRADGGRVLLAGVGVLLGAALVAALAGTLMLLASRLAGDVGSVMPAGRGALWVGLAFTVAALLLGAVRVSGHPAATAAVLPLGALAVAAAWVAGSIVAARPNAPPMLVRLAPFVLPGAVLAAVVIATVVAVAGVLRDGTYATPAAAATASAALLGLAALEATRVPDLRRLAFALSLLAPAVV